MFPESSHYFTVSFIILTVIKAFQLKPAIRSLRQRSHLNVGGCYSSKAVCRAGDLLVMRPPMDPALPMLCITALWCYTQFSSTVMYNVLHYAWHGIKIREEGAANGISKQAKKFVFRESFFFSVCSHWKDSRRSLCWDLCEWTVQGRKFYHVTSAAEEEWFNSPRLVATMPLEVWISRGLLIQLTWKYSTGISMLMTIMLLYHSVCKSICLLNTY